MKVAIALMTYGTEGFGGIERATHYLARGLVQNGAAVTVLAGSSARPDGEEITVHALADLSVALPASDDDIHHAIAAHRSALEKAVVKALDVEAPDYLLIADPVWGILGDLTDWRHRLASTGLVLHFCHGPIVLNGVADTPVRDIFAVSESLVRDVKRVQPRLAGRAVQLLPNGIRIDEFERPEASRADAILIHARMSPEKGVIDAVRAFGTIAGECESQLWLWSGSFPFGDAEAMLYRVQALATELGIANRLQYFPKAPWSTIPHIVRSARLVVIPSYKETFGMAALEAMASSTPLVASTAGNLPYLIQDSALLVDPGDVQGIAKAMLRLLNDAPLATALSMRGVRRARSFDATVVASEFLRQIGAH